jgi:hypothetical protein
MARGCRLRRKVHPPSPIPNGEGVKCKDIPYSLSRDILYTLRVQLRFTDREE